MILSNSSENNMHNSRVNSDYISNDCSSNDYSSGNYIVITDDQEINFYRSETFDTLEDPTVKTRIIVGVFLNILGMFAVFMTYGILFLNAFDSKTVGLGMYIFNIAIFIFFLVILFMFFTDVLIYLYSFCKCRLSEKNFYYNVQHASLAFAFVSLILSIVTFIIQKDAVFFICLTVLFTLDNVIRHKRNAYFYDRRTILDVFLLRTP
jgi:hypothetical protein